VALKRLTPITKNLGYLRLWQDDLAEVITLVKGQRKDDVMHERLAAFQPLGALRGC
jgi:hypothetical protein